jgi:outer membrane protein TolC
MESFSRYFILFGLLLLLVNPLPGFAQERIYAASHSQGPQETNVQPIELRASLIKTDNYPVDLATVLKLVESQNLILAQSQKNTEILQNRLRQSQAQLLPSITGSLSSNWQQGQQGVISGANGGFISGSSGSSSRRGSSAGGAQHFVQTQLGVSWTLYPGGRHIYQILAAKRRKVSADHLLKETYQEQLANAAQEYYKLLAAYQQKGVIARSIADVQEQVRANQAKVKIGKGIPLELSQAKTAYAQQQSTLIQTESSLLTAEQNLLNRLNLDPTIHLVPHDRDALKHSLIPETLSAERLIAHAVSINPSILSGEEELKALGYDYKMVRSDLIPSLTLNASVRGSGSALSEMQRSESIGFTMNTTLLQNMGVLVPLQMQERKKLMEQRALAQKQLIRDIQSRVMSAFLSSENYESAIDAAQQALASAEESYQLALGRFQAGYGIYLDVLNADAQLATARNNLAQAVLNYNQAQVQLVHAVGMADPATLTQGLQLQGPSNHGPTSQK